MNLADRRPPATGALIRLHMIRVLYAEDESQVSAMVRLLFEYTAPDCSVEVVENGRRCLERMAESSFDVVMVDLMMPELDGLEVLGSLAARRDPTPVIMVSCHGQADLAVKALRAGAVDCLDKNSPEFRRVPEIIRRVHARRQAQPVRRDAATAREVARVLYVDANPLSGGKLTELLADQAKPIQLEPVAPDDFDAQLAAPEKFAAVVVGPELMTTDALNLLRKLRSFTDDVPAIVMSARADGEKAIAAFNLGAHDFIVQNQGYQSQLVFSLNNAINRAETTRLNVQLTRQLAELNRSLEAQVSARTTELRELSARLLRIQEDERRALAQELHDQVGQMLTGLRFQLETAQKGTPEQAAALGEAVVLADDLLRHVRSLTLQLRPRILDDLGLQPALEWHLNLFQRQTNIAVQTEYALPEQRLSGTLSTAVFRIVQEALTNVARHSGSKSAHLTVVAHDGQLIVEISDRGRGFDPEGALARRDSLGLSGMVDRVKLSGGRVEIFSRVGQGTRVHAEFPLDSHSAPTSS